MRAKQSQSAEAVVKDIRRQTRRKFTAEEKIRIVRASRMGGSIHRRFETFR